MGHRLSKIYTRTGDKGTTGLGDGKRAPKDSPRIEAIGAVDELNSVLGLLLTHEVPAEVHAALVEVQHELFDLGGELCIAGSRQIGTAHVTRLERFLDDLNARLEPLREFILPGGTPPAAVCHLARAVCRRAERRVVTLAAETEINPETIVYLNRLSDLLFVVARHLNQVAGAADVLWRHVRGAQRES